MSIDITGDESWENNISIHSLYDHVVGNDDEGANDGTDDGRSNVPIRQLANRTIAIKEKLKNYGIEVEDNPTEHVLPGTITARHCIQSYGLGIDIGDAAVDCTKTIDEVGTGSSRNIDFGINMSDVNYGGMTILKNIDQISNWRLNSTLFDNVSQNLIFTSFDGLQENANGITSFNNNGVTVGNDVDYNQSGNNIFELGFSTTHYKQITYENVKCVVFDIYDNHGNASYISIRSIEFFYRGVKIELAPSDYTTNVTHTLPGNYSADYVFDTSLSKTGSSSNNVEWASDVITEQRLVVQFNTNITFDQIKINNSHNSGNNTTIGINKAHIVISEIPITLYEFGEWPTGTHDIYIGNIEEHTPFDVPDNESYCRITWAYNPASGFFMMVYNGTSGNNYFRNILRKSPIFCSVKGLDDISYVPQVYTDKTGGYTYLSIFDNSAKKNSGNSFITMDHVLFGFGTNSGLNSNLQNYLAWGFVGDDLSHLSPSMTGIEGSSACKLIIDGGTFDCGMTESEIDFLLIKRTDDTGNWMLFPFNHVTGGIIEDYLAFNDINPSYTTISVPHTITGSEITIDDSWVGDYVVLVIGKSGTLDLGQTVNINADSNNPFIASIADGFGSYGQKDYLIKEDVTKNLSFTETDGLYFMCVNKNNVYTLESQRPEFDDSPSIMRGDGKLCVADIQIMNETIVECDPMPIGNIFITPWWPVNKQAIYFIENVFKTRSIKIQLCWQQYYNSTGMYFLSPNSVNSFDYGANASIYSSRLYIRTGQIATAAPGFDGGFYKIIMERMY